MLCIEHLARVLLLVILLSVLHGVQASQGEKDKLCRADIQSLLKSYEKALNQGDLKQVLSLYAKDGVFMPSSKPTSTGQQQIKQAYQQVFNTLGFDVRFHTDEIVRRDDLAFVRTLSDGKIKLRDKNMTIKNNSRELFVLKRIDGDWKIYRYMFNEAGQVETL